MTDYPPPGEVGLAGEVGRAPGHALGSVTPGGMDPGTPTADETARHRLEGQFHQAQKMEAMGRLAGGMAHDFNNLLTVIVGYAQILQDGQPLTETGREAVGQIIRATDRGTALTRQLLAFSRRQVLAPVVFDLGRLVRELEPALRRLLADEIKLQVVVASDLGRVKADRSQFEQVVTNLVVNARDAMPDGGIITVQVCNVPAHDPPPPGEALRGPCVRLSVRDNGPGMDEETRDRIFEPFLTLKGDGRKTSLGLAMAYGVVQQSGGSLEVDSAPGFGSTFSLHLPRVEEQIAPAPPAPEVVGTGGSETVLVVEDDDLLRRLAVRALKSRGYHVLEAGDGFEALRAAREHAGVIHLLLTDVVMPGMSGRQLADAMAVLRADTRVLYMSGHNQDAILQQGVEPSRVEFLPKPFTRDVLASRVRQVLGVSKRA